MSHTCRPSGATSSEEESEDAVSRHASQPTVTQTSQIYKSGLENIVVDNNRNPIRPKEHRFNSSAVSKNPNAPPSSSSSVFCVHNLPHLMNRALFSFHTHTHLVRVLVKIRERMRKKTKKRRKRTILSNAA